MKRIQSDITIFAVFSVLTSFVLLASEKTEKNLYLGYEVLPSSQIYSRPASQSQWLWNADAPVVPKAESFFRYTFDVPEAISRVLWNVHSDDSGTLYLNGEAIHPRDFSNKVKTGKNVLAFHLKNGYGASGLLFYGEIALESGKRIQLHSDNSVKAAAKMDQGWEKQEFDDSAWKTALLQGDVLSFPWARHGEYISSYTSAEEKAKINAEKSAALTLPEGIADGQELKAKVVYQGQMPSIDVNGKLLLPLMQMGGVNEVFQDNIALKFSELGIKIFQTDFDAKFFYRAPGVYDFIKGEEEIRRLFHLVPDALLLIHFKSNQMDSWCKENLDELIGYATGPVVPNCYDERLERAMRPSAASTKYRAEVMAELRALTDYIRQQPWGKRVIGFRLSYGIYTEWHTYGMYEAPDTGKRMTEVFRQYLADKYGTDSALQKAWNQPSVTLNTALVPGLEARRNEGGYLLDPIKNRQALDYYDCHANVQADLLLEMAKEVKTSMPGKLCGAYYGYVFSTHPPEGANVLLDKVLSSPYIDYLSDPASYTPLSRHAGGDFAHRTIPATFRRYGKLAIIEDDSRFHQFPTIVKENHTTRSELETRAVVRRNFCNMLFDGSGSQIADPAPGIGLRPHYFDHPVVLEEMKKSLAVTRQFTNIPLESGNNTAVVVDYRERLRMDNNAWQKQYLLNDKVYGNIQQAINRSGVAYDMLTLQDFLVSKQNYKVVVFLNLFGPTPEERDAIIAKVRRPRVTAVWMIAPGSVTENGFSDKSMSELVGIKLSGSGINPAVQVVDKKVRKTVAGAVLTRFPNGARSFFCAEPPTSGELWQKLLRMAGSHVYVAPGNYFRRHGDIFMLHTNGRENSYKIRLPKAADKMVTELFTKKEYPASDLVLETDGPQTWFFQLINSKTF